MTIAPEGRKLLRLEIRNAETPIERKPNWIKTRAKMGPEYTQLKGLVKREGLHTVCEEAGCPNIYECWGRPRSHLPDRRRAVHTPLRLLPDRHRQARSPRPRRAPSRRGKRSGHGPSVLHDHRRRPRRPPPTAAPGSTPRPSARSTNSTRAPRREPGSGLQRQARTARRGLRLTPRGTRTQPRDRPPASSSGSVRHSGTSAASTSSPQHATTDWSPSPT